MLVLIDYLVARYSGLEPYQVSPKPLILLLLSLKNIQPITHGINW